jgi:enoyl-CoA hydratase/carnithine racemase
MIETTADDDNIVLFSIKKSHDSIPFCFEFEKKCHSIIDNHTKVLVITSELENFAQYCHINNEDDCIGVINTLIDIKIPIIAAIESGAKSYGLELALACDIRVCNKDATFALNQISDGMPFRGATQILPRLIGKGRALDMILTSKEINATEAKEMGLISYINDHSAIDKAICIARSISKNTAPVATRFAKESIINGLNMTLRQGILFESDLNIILHSTRDRAEGIEAFVQRRPPEYLGE